MHSKFHEKSKFPANNYEETQLAAPDEPMLQLAFIPLVSSTVAQATAFKVVFMF